MPLSLHDLEAYYAGWYRDPDETAKGNMSMNLYPYTKIFSPIRINTLELKNRLVMAPMGNTNFAEETGRPSTAMVAYYEERAKGGTALLTSGMVPISQNIDPTVLEKGGLSYFPRISGSRTFWSGWRDVVRAVHPYGARFFIQLSAGLGRVGSPECLLTKHRFPRSASYNRNFYLPSVPCLRFSDRSLRKIIKNAGQAAADAQAMMVDGVYLHAHEGYLMEQMANRAFNRRVLGRYADPQRFGLDMVEEIRRRCGADFPIMFRIDLSLMLNVTYGESMQTEKALKKFRHERTVEETLAYMEKLVKAGVDLFDIDLGCYDNWWLPHPPVFMPPACFADVAEQAKQYFLEKNIVTNKGLPVPIVAVGKLGYPDLAEQVLREGKADMIMLGRPLLADAYWPAKAYAGKVPDIRPCIGCQEACLHEVVKGGHPYCTVNPRCAFESRFKKNPDKAPTIRRIAVVGAGPAGVECACTAAERGHEVWLFDEKEKVGGTALSGSAHPFKKDLLNYLEWLQRRVMTAAREMPNFHYCPSTLASVNMLEDERFDAIICATGAEPVRVPIPGAERAISGVEASRNRALFEGKKDVVIIGGGQVGCELALDLADGSDRKVTLIESTPWLMKNVNTANRGYLIHYLVKKGVQIKLCTRVTEIAEDEIRLLENVSDSVPRHDVSWTPILPDNIPNPSQKPIRKEEKEAAIPCDACVLAVGMKPRGALFRELQDNYCAPEIYMVGDAFKAASIQEAVHAGYRLGLEL